MTLVTAFPATAQKIVKDQPTAATEKLGHQASMPWFKHCENAPWRLVGEPQARNRVVCLTYQRSPDDIDLLPVSAVIRQVDDLNETFALSLPLTMRIPAGISVALVTENQWDATLTKWIKAWQARRCKAADPFDALVKPGCNVTLEKVFQGTARKSIPSNGPSLDKKVLATIDLQFTICHAAPGSCVAELEVSTELIGLIAASGGVMIVGRNSAHQPVTFPVSLVGLASAQTGLPPRRYRSTPIVPNQKEMMRHAYEQQRKGIGPLLPPAPRKATRKSK